MQAGTTGINAMRVYNVTKQGQDQDPTGEFIRKYVPELKHVPTEYIHEPHKMSASLQKKFKVMIEGKKFSKCSDGLASFVIPVRTDDCTQATAEELAHYPYPIVDEKSTAKVAKDKLSEIRKQEATKEEAQRVYIKHGSRRGRSDAKNSVSPKAPRSGTKRAKTDNGQVSLLKSFQTQAPVPTAADRAVDNNNNRHDLVVDPTDIIHESPVRIDSGKGRQKISPQKPSKTQPAISSFFEKSNSATNDKPSGSEWSCKMCTFINDKPLALACGMCGSTRH
jgi:hypothetical protein